SATNTSSSTYTQTFTYDAVTSGNITRKVSGNTTSTYGYSTSTRPHAATSMGSNSYAYNNNGDMTTRAGSALTWDTRRLVTSIATTSYAYDADGARIQKIYGATTTRYLGDDLELATSSGTWTKYIAAGGVPVAKRVGTTTYWLHTDHEGSVQSVTDSS